MKNITINDLFKEYKTNVTYILHDVYLPSNISINDFDTLNNNVENLGGEICENKNLSFTPDSIDVIIKALNFAYSQAKINVSKYDKDPFSDDYLKHDAILSDLDDARNEILYHDHIKESAKKHLETLK